MRFSRAWLADYVQLPDSAEELARRLTAAGFAVELIEEVAGDVVYDIDVTTNRPDAMNHFGLAREIALLSERPLTPPAVQLAEGAEAAADAVRVTIEEPELCSRYAAKVIRGVKVGPSPPWLVQRLEAIGSRSISNVVDVTNYVLWELGQPLHAFDLAKLAGREIRVRRAGAGETLVTLDNVERKLSPDMLVITDAQQAVALAGVMGGRDSEVTETTTDILLESAWFDPGSVRRTAKQLGMHTDASHRFERGADPEMQARATERAAALIVAMAGGTVLAGTVDVIARQHAPQQVALDLDRLERFAGIPFAPERVEAIFRGLGCQLEPTGPRRYRVTAPSWRRDFEEPADLFEEVLRIVGFDAVPPSLPSVSGSDGPATPRQRLRRQVRRVLAACGYSEAVNLAFGSAEEALSIAPCGEREAEPGRLLRLDNPLSEALAVMRPSLLPGLINAARFNARRNAPAVRLFEIGVVFTRTPSGAVIEREAVALVAGGRLGTPWQRAAEIDFFDVKGTVETLAGAAGVELTAAPAVVHGLLPGATAELTRAGNTDVAGRVGQLAAAEDAYPLFVAEIELAALELPEETRLAGLGVSLPPRLPGISVDLTFTHALDVPWQELAAVIRAAAAPELAHFGLKDRYQGAGVAAGAVNTTLTFHYQAGDRQLTQDEVNRHQDTLTRALDERFGGRGQEQIS